MHQNSIRAVGPRDQFLPASPVRAAGRPDPVLRCQAWFRSTVALLLLVSLAGCAGMVIGAGATVGVAALDERGIQGVARDTALVTHIRGKWLNHDLDKGGTVAVDASVDVYERRALLTGVVKSEEARVTAVRLTWQVDGITEVLNELSIGPGGLEDAARDTWITTQLTSKLTFDQKVKAVNYSIRTANAVVYLFGGAQDDAELRRALGHARSIARVRGVVNHVRVLPPKPVEQKPAANPSGADKAS